MPAAGRGPDAVAHDELGAVECVGELETEEPGAVVRVLQLGDDRPGRDVMEVGNEMPRQTGPISMRRAASSNPT
ncbi:MAG: hypothetical protein QOC82_2719 [Frankiaceae bacterium]|jgi:hypothetical protein|nr:hypothetical protein [Frankiaceae bacterium]MDQ1698593.1 hypothetical protein [Frankiaceae bacterium]